MFESTVISLDRIIGVLLDVMPGGRDELVEHARVDLPLPKTSSSLVGAGVPHVGRPSAGCWLWALRSWVIDAAGWFAVLLRLAYLGVTNAFAVLRLLPMSNRDKDVEILALRHQITVLERHLGKERVSVRHE